MRLYTNYIQGVSMASTFQARLLAKQGKISQKLVDNQIKLEGVITDVIRIRGKFSVQGDYISRIVDNIDVVEIVFPSIKDVPMRRFLQSDNTTNIQAIDGVSKETKIEPFECYAPITATVDNDDIILKFFENPDGDEPWILALKVADVLGTFGARHIIWQKLKLVYHDEILDTQLLTWCSQMANRRNILGW